VKNVNNFVKIKEKNLIKNQKSFVKLFEGLVLLEKDRNDLLDAPLFDDF
jgi:hypothetical protein